MVQAKMIYPAYFDIDYPEKADRLTSFFRIFTIIPILIILYMLLESGFVFIPTLLMILFQKKYPKWWFNWNVALMKFFMRVCAYFLLLRHEYPSTDEEQSVHIKIPYPQVAKVLSPGMPLIKWFLVIPHIIILWILYFVIGIITVIAWFAILFTGVYPQEMFNFVVGVMRWSLRVSAYALLLTTDQYPPFCLYE